MDIDLKSKDVAAFITLYLATFAILGYVVFFWYENFNFRYLWLLIFVLILLAIVFGYLFAKYALSPLIHRNKELDRLLKDTLHELNIPVATIKANVQMLKKEANEQNLKRLNRIEMAAKQLLKLYKEVDYLIKKEIDRVEKEEIMLDLLIKERIEHFLDLLENRKIELNLEPKRVFLNRFELSKVIDNLISNAIKYTPDGNLIRVTLNSKELIIEDEGVGISEERLLKVFDRYYQENRQKEGFGIGLSIVKEFCDKNSISIRILSQKDKGTKVVLDLTKN
jgi:signal transduction histidine kinase